MKMEMELAAMFLAEHLPVDIMHVDADDHIDCGKAVLGRRGFLEHLPCGVRQLHT